RSATASDHPPPGLVAHDIAARGDPWRDRDLEPLPALRDGAPAYVRRSGHLARRAHLPRSDALRQHVVAREHSRLTVAAPLDQAVGAGAGRDLGIVKHVIGGEELRRELVLPPVAHLLEVPPHDVLVRCGHENPLSPLRPLYSEPTPRWITVAGMCVERDVTPV